MNESIATVDESYHFAMLPSCSLKSMRLIKEINEVNKGKRICRDDIHSFIHGNARKGFQIYLSKNFIGNPPQISKDDHKDTYIKTGEVT